MAVSHIQRILKAAKQQKALIEKLLWAAAQSAKYIAICSSDSDNSEAYA